MTKRNPILIVMTIVGFLLFGGALIAAKSASGQGETKNSGVDSSNVEQEIKAAEPIQLGVDERQLAVVGSAFTDTPADTLRTVGVAYLQTKDEQQKLSEDLNQTKAQQDVQNEKVQALEQQLTSMGDRLNQALENVAKLTQQSTQSIREHQTPVREVMKTANAYDELGIDSTKDDFNAWDDPKSAHQASAPDANAFVWHEPLDAKQDEQGQWITPALTAMKAGKKSLDDNFEASGQFDANQAQGKPVFTLHRGSVMADAVSLTALMGRIPTNGQVTDPYPFSMVVGSKNLMANGFMLPDVEGAIVTGTVTGDWSLKCVRGAVESIDLIRSDGSILSYPEESGAIDSGFDGSSIKTDDLGFLADPNGNPCLTGIRISNAPEYLTQKGMLDAATAAANAVAIAQQTVSVDGSTSTSALTGSALKSAAGESAAAFTGTVSEFLQARMGQSFDIIYVEPGVKAAIHLRKPITLREPATPLKVNYETTAQGATYALP